MCLSIVFVLYIWTYTDSVAFVEKYMQLSIQTKMMITVGFVVFVVVGIGVLKYLIQKEKDDDLVNWMFCLIVIEFFLHLCLSPLWLEIMYGIPYMVNLFMRVIKTIVVIPLFSMIGFPIVKLAKKLY